MQFDCKSIVAKELFPDEIVLWQGRPSLAKAFTKSDIFLVPFSIFWGGFSIVWCILAATASVIFALFGIPFLVVGLYLMFGRFLLKKANKKNTCYAITNKRVLAVKTNANGSKKNVVSAQISAIPSESVSVNKNGIGTIIFGVVPFGYMAYQNTGLDFFVGLSQNNAVSFFDVENCESALQIYKNAKYQNCTL